MEEKPPIKISSYIFASLIVASCGWGMFWMGTNGIKLALNNTDYFAFKSFVTYKNNEILDNTKSNTTNTASTLNSLPTKKSDTISVLIAGDVMLDRGVRRLGNQYGYEYLFKAVTPLFKKSDITMVNLEGPITNNSSKTLLSGGKTSKELTFTFATTTAKVLNDVGISIVNLANNHTTNFGGAGLKETKKWLTDAEVKWFGSPWNSSSTEAIITKNNISVAFVGYHAFETGFDRVLNSVKNLSREGNFVIVMPHWGTEYATSSSAKMRSQAKLLANAGAGAILGSHPHVILNREWIGEVPVFYSLGNLLFDQYFSPEVMKGNIVELSLIRDLDITRIDKVHVYEVSIKPQEGISLNDNVEEFTQSSFTY